MNHTLGLDYVVMEGFRTFYDRTRIDFPGNGLVLIDGLSGSGKSNILLAISWVLDFAPTGYTNEAMESWGSKVTQVDLGMHLDGAELLVSKGKSTFLEYKGKRTTGAKAVKEELQSLLGVSGDTLGALCYRPQRSPSKFLSMTDAQKKQWLSTLLGLNRFEESATVAAKAAKELNNKIVAYTETLATQRRSHEMLAQTATPRPEVEDYSSKITELQSAPPQTFPKARMLEEGRALLATLLAEQETKTQAFRSEMDRYSTILALANRQRDEQSAAKARKRALESDLAKMQGNLCPTCNQSWNSPQAALDSILAEVARCETVLAGLVPEVPPKPTSEPTNPMIPKVQAAIKELELAQAQFQQAMTGELARLQGLQRVSIQRVQDWEKAKAKTDAALASSLEQIALKERQISDTQTAANAELDYSSLVGKDGFLGVIFEEILNEIEGLANQFMSRMTNVANVSVQFSTVKQTSKALENSITCLVSVAGNVVRWEAALSGGQKTSLDRAVDRAVREVISNRSGLKVEFLLEDETFEGQGASKESALELLREEAASKVIVVIDHAADFKESFSRGLLVTNESGKSVVREIKKA